MNFVPMGRPHFRTTLLRHHRVVFLMGLFSAGFLWWLLADGCLFGLLYMRQPHCFRRWRCRYSVILDGEGPWLARTGFGKLILTADPRLDPLIARDLHYRGYWEPEIERVFRMVLREKPGGMVMDVGANIGYFSLLALALQQSVVMVEMQSELVSLLTATMTLNGLYLLPNRRVKIVQAVLSDQAGTGFDYVSKASNPGGVHAIEGAGGPLKSRTLDSVTAETMPANQSIVLLKIDVEGHEERVLLGGKETLRRCENVIVEGSVGFIKKLIMDDVWLVQEINEDQSLGEIWNRDTLNPVLSTNAASGQRSNFWLKREKQ